MPIRHYDEESDRADFEREARTEAHIDDLRSLLRRALKELRSSGWSCDELKKEIEAEIGEEKCPPMSADELLTKNGGTNVLKGRKITILERSKGRSENYWQKTPEQQWREDERLGILDWNGK